MTKEGNLLFEGFLIERGERLGKTKESDTDVKMGGRCQYFLETLG